MNREQAEHILDAYVDLVVTQFGDGNARHSLREVILDAMTTFKPATGGIVTTPYIGYPLTNKGTFVGVDYPKDWEGPPKETCTFIDPMSKEVTANAHE